MMIWTACVALKAVSELLETTDQYYLDTKDSDDTRENVISMWGTLITFETALETLTLHAAMYGNRSPQARHALRQGIDCAYSTLCDHANYRQRNWRQSPPSTIVTMIVMHFHAQSEKNFRCIIVAVKFSHLKIALGR